MSVRLGTGLRRHLARNEWWSACDTIVVALSGGMDSSVLLHLLRFSRRGIRPHIVAAHFDHAMRARSAEDARWVRGLCRAWAIELHTTCAETALRSESEARTARYAFLEEVRERAGARWVLTAHHADDQAETVLFRALRGTGLRGLAGIPQERAPGILRPLLPFTRSEIEAYAEAVGLRALEDESNSSTAFARNVIRNEILPRAESAVAAGARRSLSRLADIAREDVLAWQSVLPEVIRRVTDRGADGVTVVDRTRLLSYPAGVRKRIVRHLARELGARLDERSTRIADAFLMNGESGRTITMGGGVCITRSFETITIQSAPLARPEDRTLTIAEPSEGMGRLSLGGRIYDAQWSLGTLPMWQWVEHFAWSALGESATLRGWLPGDRISLDFGSKKLKKLFAEARVPAQERVRVPVLANGAGQVLWVPGLARARGAGPEDSDTQISIAIQEAV